MYLKYPHYTVKKINGSALVVAIFVIIVVSLLGVALVKMLSTESKTIAYEVVGTRALQAAQSGAQWQLQQLFPLDNVAQACPVGTITRFFNNQTNEGRGLFNCQATVTCSDFIHTNGIRYYQIESAGQCQTGDVITSRIVNIEAKSLP